MKPEIIPVEHASAVIRWGDTIFYTDPVGAAGFADKPAADVILLTDIHHDHCDIDTLKAVAGGATLIAPQAVADMLPEELKKNLTIIGNGEAAETEGFHIEAVPMYNYPEKEDSWHTKGRGNGYVVEKDGVRLYIAGDTSAIPEMRALKDIDIALLPMNLPYTMSVEEAAEGVLDFKPKQVYPYHFRSPDGFSDVEQFKKLVNAGNPDIEVVLAEWYPSA